MIIYGSIWTANTGVPHTITVYMKYTYYGVNKYFCKSSLTGRSKLVAEDYIKMNYSQEQ